MLEDAVAVRDVVGRRLALAQIALRINDRSADEVSASRALELLPGHRDARALLAQARG